MHVLVLAGSECSAGPLLVKAVEECDLLFAANGGTHNAYMLGRKPDLVVGDLDSLPDELARRLEADRVEVLRHPWRKDKTDLHIAMLEAAARGADRVTIACALGGERLDHTIANLLLLGSEEFGGLELRLIEGAGEAFVVRTSKVIEGRPGDLLTLCPLSPLVEGVTITGAEWPLQDRSIRAGDTLGVSNYLAGESARVSLSSGMLLVIHEHIREVKAIESDEAPG